MGKRKETESEFGYVTRRELVRLFAIPQRVIDQWIATGQLTEMRMSVFGRGGQRVFYSAADAKRLAFEKPRRAHKRRAPGKTRALPKTETPRGK